MNYLKIYSNKNLGDDLFIDYFLKRYKNVHFVTICDDNYLHYDNLTVYKKNISLFSMEVPENLPIDNAYYRSLYIFGIFGLLMAAESSISSNLIIEEE